MKKSDIKDGMLVKKDNKSYGAHFITDVPSVARVVGEPFLKGSNMYYVNVEMMGTLVKAQWYVRNISPFNNLK